MRSFVLPAALLLGLLVSACSEQSTQLRAASERADALYYGGDIITMDPAQPIAEALAVKNGRILAVGKLKDLLKYQGAGSRFVNLSGKALVPGFIDTDAHLTQVGLLGKEPSLSSSPRRPITNMATLIQLLQQHIRDQQIPPGTLVLGWNYDESLLYERRHPTRLDLDLVSRVHPVCVIQVSGEIAACNSLALRRLGISEFDAPDPAGGHIRRDPRGRPIGVLEGAAISPIFHLQPVWTPAPKTQELQTAQNFLVSQGITTVLDSGTPPETFLKWQTLAKRGELNIDILAYPLASNYEQLLAARQSVGSSENHLKFAGISLIQDGAIYERLAYLSQPYYKSRRGDVDNDAGQPVMPQYQLNSWVDQAFYQKIPVRIQCQGDACTDMAIQAVGKARAKYHSDLSAVLVGAQVLQPQQLNLLAQVNLQPSFAVMDPYLYAARYRATLLGPLRANRVAPLREAQQHGLQFSIHSGAPTTGGSPVQNLWVAVTRSTQEGESLGPDEGIDVTSALRALTLNAAIQCGEQDRKGSLRPGKLADLVILSDDPLRVEPQKLAGLKVLETIKEGKSVYKLEGGG